MLHIIKKSRGLKLILYDDYMIGINYHFSTLHGTKASDKICETEMNKILLKIMPNSWSIQSYVHFFYCESITLQKLINMFEPIEISQSIYEVV